MTYCGPDLIIFFGKDEHTIRILQNYLDNENDIQTVGLLSVYLYMFKFPCDDRLKYWYQTYSDLLSRLELFDNRALVDREYSDLKQKYLEKKQAGGGGGSLVNNRNASNCFELLPSNTSKMVWCTCNFQAQKCTEPSAGTLNPYLTHNFRLEKRKVFNCDQCSRPYANCAICLLPINIKNTITDNSNRPSSGGANFFSGWTPTRTQNTNRNTVNHFENFNVDDALIWCLNCKHGGHYKHIVDWFNNFKMCHVNDCPCECSSL